MSVKLSTPDGFRFEADTPDEAVRLYRDLSGSSQRQQPKRRARVTRESSDDGQPLNLSDASKKLLEALCKIPQGMATDDLAEAAKVHGAALPPMIRAARKSLEDSGLHEPLGREAFHVGGRPKSRYKLTAEAIRKVEEQSS